MALQDFFHVDKKVQQALDLCEPVVALESTVITHGLPYPENFQTALEMEARVARAGAVPATIAVLEGRIFIRVDIFQLKKLAKAEGLHKISARDFSAAVARGWSGGTTVAGTLLAAHLAGIQVFATGGIGGVHRQAPFDISADLQLLARTPLVVVCAGAKAILDLPATVEVLETYGVPVVGYQTDEFPAFYSPHSGLPVSVRLDSAAEVAQLARAHWALGRESAVLVVAPPPAEEALETAHLDQVIQQALAEMEAQQVRGQQVTPFLLSRVSEMTDGASLRANLALLKNNAQIAGQIACELSKAPCE